MTAIMMAKERPALDEILPDIIHDLLSYDEFQHKRILEQYFADDAKLSHPLLTVQGTYNIRKVFRVWTSLNLEEPTIMESYMVDGQTAIIHTIQHFRPRIMPFLHLKVPAITTLKFQETDEGLQVTHQSDTWTLDGLIQSVPLINWWYENIVRVMMGKFVSGAGSFIYTANQATSQLTAHAGEIRERSSEVIAPYQDKANKFVAPYSAKVQGITAQAKAIVYNVHEEVIQKISQVRGIQALPYDASTYSAVNH